jgi:hypothetical protein
MSLVSATIPNLVNGVSQQPFALRLASQAELQVNGDSSVVEGLKKRAPTKHRAKLTTTPLSNALVHTINRDLTEKYTVILTNGSVRVFDLDGTERTVSYPGGTNTYLASSNPKDDFKVLTVADYTFIVNRAITVQRSTVDLTPVRNPEAMIWVRQGAYSAEYRINIDGAGTAFYKSSDGSVSAHSETVRTDLIAQDLANDINTFSGYVATVYGSVVHVRRGDNGDFGISVSDSLGDQAIRLAKTQVQKFTDLPAKAIPGFRVKVAGNSEENADDYYVEYEAQPNQNGGAWKECAKGGEQRSFVASTMPHALRRKSDGTFELVTLEWKSRLVGDLVSNPFPTFSGKKLTDVFFHRNRLGFLVDENVVMSKAGEFFDFFRESAIQLVDSDPIDVAVSHTKVSILRHAIPFNETLLLFSDQTQFQLSKADILAPKTVGITQTTEFECAPVKPIGVGQNIYFAQANGRHSAIREYYVDGETKTNDAAEITSHVPKFLPSNIYKLAASSTEDIIVALSSNTPNRIYVYRYYWANNEKLQSSWFYWELAPGDTILNADFIESELFVLVSRSDGSYLETIPVEEGYTEEGKNLPVLLDRLVDEDQCSTSYNAVANTTTITLPYIMDTPADFRVIAWDDGGAFKDGYQCQVVSSSGNQIVVRGNLTGFRAGRVYRFRYRFSQFVVRERAPGGGQMAVMSGRVQVRRVRLIHTNSGYFKVIVTPFRRNPYTYVFSGRVVGDGENVIGSPAVNDTPFSFAVNAKSDLVTIDIESDSHMPCAFLSAEWEAMYQLRSRRIM